MNVENMRKLRDVIARFAEDEAKEGGRCERFDMSSWFEVRPDGSGCWDSHYNSLDEALKPGDEAFNPDPDQRGCGTAACLAGWAQVIGVPEYATKGGKARAAREPAEEFAQRWLGLTDDQAAYLFYGDWGPTRFMSRERLTATMAVQALDHILATGKIDTRWRVGAGEG